MTSRPKTGGETDVVSTGQLIHALNNEKPIVIYNMLPPHSGLLHYLIEQEVLKSIVLGCPWYLVTGL